MQKDVLLRVVFSSGVICPTQPLREKLRGSVQEQFYSCAVSLPEWEERPLANLGDEVCHFEHSKSTLGLSQADSAPCKPDDLYLDLARNY